MGVARFCFIFAVLKRGCLLIVPTLWDKYERIVKYKYTNLCLPHVNTSMAWRGKKLCATLRFQTTVVTVSGPSTSSSTSTGKTVAVLLTQQKKKKKKGGKKKKANGLLAAVCLSVT